MPHEMMNESFLSIILPAYNAAGFIEGALKDLLQFLESLPFKTEVIVVNDGSTDNTGEIVSRLPVKLINLPRNHGKGAAISTGMLAAKGDVCIFTDADIPYDYDLIPAAFYHISQSGCHAIIGNRILPSSEYHQKISLARKIMSLTCSKIVGMFVAGGYFDTQCGFKAFNGDVARELFSVARVNRFAIDVEVIYLLLVFSLNIHQMPVKLRVNYGSTVRPFSDSLQFLYDLFAIVKRRMKHQYRNEYLENLFLKEHLEEMEQVRKRINL